MITECSNRLMLSLPTGKDPSSLPWPEAPSYSLWSALKHDKSILHSGHLHLFLLLGIFLLPDVYMFGFSSFSRSQLTFLLLRETFLENPTCNDLHSPKSLSNILPYFIVWRVYHYMKLTSVCMYSMCVSMCLFLYRFIHHLSPLDCKP